MAGATDRTAHGVPLGPRRIRWPYRLAFPVPIRLAQGETNRTMISLSVVIATLRDDLFALARVLQACSWAGPRVQIVVRDACGSAVRAELLHGIAQENCRLIVAPPCDARTNRREALREARGDFVCLLDDDALCFDRAIAMLPGVIEGVLADPAIVGVAAPALIETAQGAQAFAYPNIDADDPLVRLSGFLSAPGPNLLASAPVRRTTLLRALEAIDERPFAFAFDDRLVSLLCLLGGRFARTTRLMRVEDAGAQADGNRPPADTEFYRAARLDPATDRLYWYLCGFEGASLIRTTALDPDYSPEQRQALADLWLSAMFARFRDEPRGSHGSPLGGEADALCGRWREAGPRLPFDDMLADICRFLALSSQDNARRYAAFWSARPDSREAPAA